MRLGLAVTWWSIAWLQGSLCPFPGPQNVLGWTTCCYTSSDLRGLGEGLFVGPAVGGAAGAPSPPACLSSHPLVISWCPCRGPCSSPCGCLWASLAQGPPVSAGLPYGSSLSPYLARGKRLGLGAESTGGGGAPTAPPLLLDFPPGLKVRRRAGRWGP